MQATEAGTVGKLNASVRSETGKGAARKMRAAGQIPAVVYGGEGGALSLALDPKGLQKALDPVKKRNTVITLAVGNEKPVTVMLKDYQVHPIKHVLTHADFVRVDITKDVQVTVPLVVTGKAQGVKDGGILHQSVREIPLVCKPTDIPNKIEVDVTGLMLGDALHVSDLKLPAGVTTALSDEESVLSIVAPRAEKVAATEVAADAAAEGAPAAAGAAGAKAPAAAAGAKAPAAAAGAKAPAAAGGKK